MRVMAYLLHAAMPEAIAEPILAPSRRGHIPLKTHAGPARGAFNDVNRAGRIATSSAETLGNAALGLRILTIRKSDGS
jgi:hypothetical protein